MTTGRHHDGPAASWSAMADQADPERAGRAPRVLLVAWHDR
jgi:hypothetical protein